MRDLPDLCLWLTPSLHFFALYFYLSRANTWMCKSNFSFSDSHDLSCCLCIDITSRKMMLVNLGI